MPNRPRVAAFLAAFLASPCLGGSDSSTAYDDVRTRAQNSHAQLDVTAGDTGISKPTDGKKHGGTLATIAPELVVGQLKGEGGVESLVTQNWSGLTQKDNKGVIVPDGASIQRIANIIHEHRPDLLQAFMKTMEARMTAAQNAAAGGPVPEQVSKATDRKGDTAPDVALGKTLITSQHPTVSAFGYEKIGDGNLRAGNTAGAFQSFDAAYQRFPTPENQYKRGYAAEKLGDTELANSDARSVLRSEPSNREAHSLFMLTRGRPSSVRLLGEEGLGGKPGPSGAAGRGDEGASAAPSASYREASGGAETAVGGMTAEEIAAQENAAFNSSPVTARSAQLTRDAKAALRVKDSKSALRLTEEAIQADPNNADARYVRATAYLQLREPAKAAFEASAGLALAPDNAPLLYTRSVAYGRQKLWRDAYADAEGAVRNAPRAAYAYQVRAAANWALGRKPEMMEDLRASARLDRHYAAALQRASQLPSDVDPTLLYSDEPTAAVPAQAPPASRPPYLFWAIGSLLAVIGIAPFLVPDLRGKVTTVFRRGPSTVPDGLPAAGQTGEVPLTGFWKRYEVTREIGAGGMGVVYEAWDRQLERRVAVKRMRDEIRNDRRERERFLQEARMVARLRHPNLVEIYGIEEDGDDAYLVFEFVEGQNLHQMLGEKGRFSPSEARDVFRGLCAGIDYAHRQGIVHRDLKPANVIVEPDGTVKVMDFGVARQAQDAMARRQMTNTIIGTPQYMAPEQEEGVVCTQSDIYALGVCLYEMLSGSAPFNGSAGAVTLAKRESRYEPLAKRVGDLPPAVAQVVDRALDPNPETRTRTALDFMRDLEAAVSNVTA